MALAQRGLSLEQFLALPEEKPALEYAEGKVTQKVSPKAKHSRLQLKFAEQLDKAGQEGRLSLAFPELRTTFGGASRVPDISVYRRERVPVDTAGELEDNFREPPDIAVEIVSPEHYRGSERSSGDPLGINALVRRCLWYVANGVAIALLVDPADESVLAFRPGQPAMAWHAQDRIDVSDVLPALQLTVDELFASVRLQ